MPSSGSDIYNLVFRLLSNGHNGAVKSSGTCIVIAPSVAITAKHVVEDFLTTFGHTTNEHGEIQPNFSLWAIQITNDDDLYAVWDVVGIWTSPHTDIAYLQFLPHNETAKKKMGGVNMQPVLSIFPPEIGSRVVGFGYHSKSGHETIEIGIDKTRHISIQDEPTTSVGEVIDIYPERRDSTLLNFPSYRVNFKSKGGMSGGPVFNDAGHLCGLITRSWELEDGDVNGHIAYVASLWPMLGAVVGINRGGVYPVESLYPALELARDGIISAPGWERIVFDANLNTVNLKRE